MKGARWRSALGRLGLVVIFLLPLAPLAWLIAAQRVPEALRADSALLSGAWEAEASGATRTVTLPGLFSKLGLPPGPVTLRRQVHLAPELQGHAHTLVFNGVQSTALEVLIDGTPVGRAGYPERGFLLEQNAIRGWVVPSALLNKETVEVTIRARPPPLARLPNGPGILGDLMLLPAAAGEWYLERNQTLLNAFQLGAVLSLGLCLLMVSYLFLLQRDRQGQRLYASTTAVIAGGLVYLISKSGFPFGLLIPTWVHFPLAVISLGTIGSSWTVFLDLYTKRPLSRFARGGLVVFPLLAVATLLIPAELPYTLLAGALFLVAVRAMVSACREAIRLPRWNTAIVAGAVVGLSLAGLFDLMTDLKVLLVPRLFSVGIGEVGLVVAGLVFAEFLSLSAENFQLTSELRVRADELATALLRAEDSSKAKTEFLANTSHELRTPLNAIINIPEGLAEQLKARRLLSCGACGAQEELNEPAPPGACSRCGAAALTVEVLAPEPLDAEETVRLLDRVSETGRQLLGVVSDILDYSKLETGRTTLAAELVSVRAVLEELHRTMEPLAEKAGVVLEVRLPDEALGIRADRAKLLQVLLNLVANAVKFSNGAGTVTVETSVKQRGDAQVLELAVSDQGIGIDPLHHQQIFEGFRQVEGSNTRRFGGTGLGLAISRRLVELHGGALRVKSELGHGSTFTVELPLGRTARHVAAA